MQQLLIKLFGLLLVSSTLFACFDKENNNPRNSIIPESINLNSEPYIDELISDGIHETNSITDFFFHEIMDGRRNLGFHRDEFEVIELFGEPLEIRIVPVNFNMVGGIVVEIHEYI